MWALYKQLTDSKPLKDATRDDGRKIVQHFESQGLRSATIQKKITWLNAATNLAIKEGHLTFNPFSSIVPKRDDKLMRLPLSEADIKTVKRNFGQLDKHDQLLFRVLAATGMRLSEAFEIENEQKTPSCSSQFAISSGSDAATPSLMIAPFSSTAQITVVASETSNPM